MHLKKTFFHCVYLVYTYIHIRSAACPVKRMRFMKQCWTVLYVLMKNANIYKRLRWSVSVFLSKWFVVDDYTEFYSFSSSHRCYNIIYKSTLIQVSVLAIEYGFKVWENKRISHWIGPKGAVYWIAINKQNFIVSLPIVKNIPGTSKLYSCTH